MKNFLVKFMDNQEVKENTYTNSFNEESKGSVAGKWLFLFTELILFGGLLIVYAGFRLKYRDNFSLGVMNLEILFGLFNTILVLSSGLTMVLSIVALKKKQKIFSLFLTAFTSVFGIMYLFNRIFEWGARFNYGLYPYNIAPGNLGSGEIMFYNLFNLITWLYTLHIFAGLIFLLIIFVNIFNDKITSDNCGRLENMGLFWQSLVIVWIFVFPLLYLLK